MHILIAEEDGSLLLDMMRAFQAIGWQVTGVGDGVTALHFAATKDYGAIVLSTTLPGIDGYRVCECLRQASRQDLPIVLSSIDGELAGLLQGFKIGADDYMFKPFPMVEMEARIEAIARRMGRNRRRILEVSDLVYDLDTLEVIRGDQLIRLNPICLQMLELLMRKSPAVVGRCELFDMLWGGEPPYSDSLRSNVHLLRRAVDKPFDIPLIHNVHGVGYQLVRKQAPTVERHYEGLIVEKSGCLPAIVRGTTIGSPSRDPGLRHVHS